MIFSHDHSLSADLVFGLLVQRGCPIPYPLFVLGGWMGWTFFLCFTSKCTLIPQYRAMMRKVYFRRPSCRTKLSVCSPNFALPF